jgi:hypothetical protein
MEIKMEYRILYQKDKSDNVRIWRMEQDGNKYRTISGIKNGNLVCSEWTVTEGKNIGKKNETSPEKQARLEVIAEYKKKLARKYHETENTINDGAKYILPMLANKFAGWGKGKLDWSSVFTQPKLDGCVSGETLITTEKGTFPMKQLYEEDVGETVLSYNTESRKIEFNKILNKMKNGVDISNPDVKWMRLTLEDGRTIKVTDNHKFWLPSRRCWREAKHLTTDDILLINVA